MTVVVGVCLALAAPIGAQERVTITGTVVDMQTRRAILGASVALPELELRLRTDEAGEFQIRNVPTGVYELRLTAPGYREAAGTLAIVRPGRFVTTLTPLDALDEEHLPGGRLLGRVADVSTELPLQDVRVHIAELSLSRLTDEDGHFVFETVPPGSHLVEFSSFGYATRRDTIAGRADHTSEARVTMAPDPVEVERIRVTVERRHRVLERRGFYERRRLTAGDFIDREDIEAWTPMQVTDVFAHVNGARTRLQDPMNPLTRAVVLTRGIAASFDPGSRRSVCYPTVYLDGQLVHMGGDDAAMLNDLLSPEEIAGIEVYHGGSSIPMGYGGANANCGVILIWTRG